MEPRGILILSLAALMHASWNLMVKRGLDKQVFLWLSMAAAAAFLAVPAVALYRPAPLTGLAYALVSGGLEALYIVLLGEAYQAGDLSVVYPVARGSAPVFVTAFAILFLREFVTGMGAAGILLVAAGVFIAHFGASGRRGPDASSKMSRSRTFLLALLTGMVIAAYSVVDKAGTRRVEPLVYMCLAFGASALLLAPYMIATRREAVMLEWRTNRVRIAGVGAMSAVAYLLVLLSMRWNKVAYVSAVREVSVVFATVLGFVALREPFAGRRLAGSLVIFAGIMCIELSR